MANFIRGVREWATPVLKDSAFLERGVLTPEEFVAAGDQLVYKCPTWSWSGGEEAKRKSHLPPDKQFLVTRGVPCRCRISSLDNTTTTNISAELSTSAENREGGGDDDWLTTHITGDSAAEKDMDWADLETIGGEEMGDIPIMQAAEEMTEGMGQLNLSGVIMDEHFSGNPGGGNATRDDVAAAEPPSLIKLEAQDSVESEYEDLSTFEEENILEDDEATLRVAGNQVGQGYMVAEEPEDTMLRVRTYDLSITYDKYYQTPRMWLFGYNEDDQPLTYEQTFEDIMSDYARRTVTMDMHPHLSLPHASVHPCKHANVMKRIVDNLMANGGTEPRTDQYLFIFLKFLGSVVPTIEYDFTVEVAAGRLPDEDHSEKGR